LSRYGGRNDDWAWRLRVLKARTLVSLNQYNETLSVLVEDMPARLASTDIAEQRQVYLGMAHRNLQQFSEAERSFEEASKIVEHLSPGHKCQLLIAQAALWVDLRKYGDAEANYKKALSIARQEKLPFLEANALADLGRLATSQRHFDEAVDINQSALQLSNSLKAKGNAGAILGNIAWGYYELGDFESALEYYEKGAESSKSSGLSANTAYWLTGVANSSAALHDYASAEALAKSTLDRALELHHGQTIVECQNILSELALTMDRLDEAELRNQEALKLEQQGIDQFGIIESHLQTARIQLKKHRFPEAEGLFSRIIEDPKAESPLKWEAEAKLAETKEQEGRLAEADRGYRKAIERIENSRSSINHEELRMSFLSVGIDVYADYIDFLIRHGRSAEALHQAELSRARTLSEGLTSTSALSRGIAGNLHPQEIARKLGASLLFYWLGHNRSYLWVITPAKTIYFALPKAADIDLVVKAYREALPNVDSALDTGASDAKKLYAMLVEPAKKLIPPGSRVVLLPAEGLYGLNFETLIVPDPKPHFWIEDVTLSTANSLTLLDASIQRPTITGKDLLLVGNAVPTPGFPALPQAPAEMKSVSRYFPDQNRKVLEAKQATATAYLNSNPERYAYLHFVTHGTASLTRPLESAVILSPEGDSYKLYARDIVTHHLNAQLVTISACNGSGKRTLSGEGVVGLSWAFLRAGAHNVIGALWEVSDASTPQLMDAFYRELFQGKDTATALRDAKLGLLHSADPDSVFKNPFYWAPFQLYAGS
jgi:CHAT domain-containing protein